MRPASISSFGDCVVLLQRHPGETRIARDGDVLRLEVLGRRRPRSVDADTTRAKRCFLPVVAPEIHRAHGGHAIPAPAFPLRQLDDADGTFRIHLPRTVAAGLTLVRHQQIPAVCSERDHVRQRAHGHRRDQRPIGAVEPYPAGRSLHRIFDCDGDDAAMGSHAVRGSERRHVNRANPPQLRGVRGVHDGHGRPNGIRHEQTAALRIVGGDFGATGVERADLLEVQGAVAGGGESGHQDSCNCGGNSASVALRVGDSSDFPC